MLASKLSSISPAFLFALAQGIFAAHAVRAEDPPVFTGYEYVGPTQGAWFTPLNWDKGVLPAGGEFDQTVIARDLTARIEAPGAISGGLFLGNSTGTGTLIVGAKRNPDNEVTISWLQKVGSLEISSGGDVTVLEESLIGHLADGFVTVTGAGSTFTQFTQNGGVAAVGSTNDGSLTISDDALATFNTGLYVGGAGGSTGTILVRTGGVLAANYLQERSSAGKLTLNGGTLRALSNGVSFLQGFAAGHVTLGPSGGTIDTQSNVITIGASIGGVGALTKSGAGKLILIGSNTYEGGTVIQAGTVQVSSSEGLGVAGSQAILDGGTLILDGSITLDHPISITSKGATIGGVGVPLLHGFVTFGGAISGTGLLKKIELGDVYLTGNNAAFSGGIQVGFGAILAGNSNAFGTGMVTLSKGTGIRVGNGAVVGNAVAITENGYIGNGNAASATYTGSVALNGGTLRINGADLVDGSLTFSGSTTGTGDVTLMPYGSNAPAAIVITGSGLNHTGTVTNFGTLSGVTKISGVIGANVTGVVQDGNSKLILSGNNLYTGNTTVAEGTLQIGDGGTSGSVAGNIINNDKLIFNRSNSYTYAKDISGSGSLEKQGAGNLTLNGNNSFTGGTTLSGGYIILGNANSLGSTGTITFAGGSLAFGTSGAAAAADGFVSRFSTASGQNYRLDAGANNVTINVPLTTPGSSFALLGDGRMTLTANNSFPGGVSLSGTAVLSLDNANAIGATGTIAFKGGVLGFTAASASSANSLAARFSTASSETNYRIDTGGQDITFSTALTASSGSLSKQGSGNLTLSGNHNYTGSTTVEAGSLTIANNSVFNSAITVKSGATLTLNIAGDVKLLKGVSGPGSVNVSGNQATARLAGDNSGFSGTFTLPSGTRGMMWSASNAGSALAKWNLNGQFAFIETGLGNSTVQLGELSGTNTATELAAFGGIGVKTFQVGALGTNSSFAGSIKDVTGFGGGGIGTVALSKVGNGTLTLLGANAYTGGTTVSAGTLLVSGSIIGATTVQSAGTLGGTGLVLGDTTVAGMLAPGSSAGLFRVVGDLTLQLGSTTAIELGDTSVSLFDRISVDDVLTYGGTLSLSLINGFTPKVGDTFQLFQDFNSQSGTFSSIAFTNPGVVGNFNYSTGTLNIVAVPEPSTGMLLGSALLGVFATRRRPQRRYP